MDTHVTGTTSVHADVVVVAASSSPPPPPETLRGRALAERIERNFPAELKAIPRWVGWKWEFRKDRWTKPPLRVDGNGYASSTDPKTWSTFGKAIAALKRPNCQLDGIGLLFVEEDELAGVDVDRFLDHSTAAVILKHFAGTYCERSPSEKLHVWTFGKVQHSGRKAAAEVEVYGHRRYFTVTGDHIDGTAAIVTNQQAALDWLHRKLFEAEPKAAKPSAPPKGGQVRDDILELARTAENGAKFASVFDGDWSKYFESQSEADLYLCARLAFWTDKSECEIDRLFRQSGLYRPKWNEPRGPSTYGKDTIGKAIAGTSETYSGPGRLHEPKRPNGSNDASRANGSYDPETGEVYAANEPIQTASSPEPIDIFGDPELTGWPELTASCLPSALFDFVVMEAARLSVDPVALSAHVLAACSLAISDEWRVRPKLNDTWTQQARIWVCVVKSIGARGTDMINSAWAPVVKRQVDTIAKWKAEVAAWTERNPTHADRKFVPNPDDPKPPDPIRYYTNNGTVESLTNILSGETRKIGYFADELASFLDFSRYSNKDSKGGGGGSRADMLKAYDGGPEFIDRVIRGNVYVPNWSGVVDGNIQQRRLADMAKLLVNDGLFQRFTVVHCAPGELIDDDDIVSPKDHVSDYKLLHDAIAELKPISSADGKLHEAWFDEEARAERQRFRKLINRLKFDESLPFIISETAAKWEGLLARLALIFHVVELAQLSLARRSNVPTVDSMRQLMFRVTGPTVIRAANYMRQILLPNLFRLGFQTMPEANCGAHARWVAKYILAHKKESLTLREIGRAYRDLRGEEQEIQKVMAYLCDAGWATANQQKRHDSFVWRINPAVHTVFATRAAAEKDRREKVRELIRQKVCDLWEISTGPTVTRAQEHKV